MVLTLRLDHRPLRPPARDRRCLTSLLARCAIRWPCYLLALPGTAITTSDQVPPHLSPTASVMAQLQVFECRNTRTDCGCSQSPSLDELPNVDRNPGENRARCLAPLVACAAHSRRDRQRGGRYPPQTRVGEESLTGPERGRKDKVTCLL
jgi:hypothetical protein